MPTPRRIANSPVLERPSARGARIRTVVIGAAAAAIFATFSGDVFAQLRGHGGPVRGIALSADGTTAVSVGFDQSAIRWSLRTDSAEQVLRFHDGSVNAVALLPDGRIVTAGEDARVALWRAGERSPERVFEGHKAPIAALAVSPDGAMIASASWDHTLRLWSVAGGAPRVLEGHRQNVNGVAFTPDGRRLVSAGYDATLRIWSLADLDAEPLSATLPTPLNAVAIAPDGEIAVAGADGQVWFLSPQGETRGSVKIGDSSVIAVAISSDGALVAAAGIRGSVGIVERAKRVLQRTLVGPGLPVWSLTFMRDNRTLLTGGADRLLRRWNATTGDHIGAATTVGPSDPLAEFAGDRGADVYRACVACHTLQPDDGNRAGPSLHGIFGRRIATLPGYNFSPALREMDIVWSKETVARLFEIGPAAYTPGTTMPEQRITSPADREALVEFLERATAKK
jgi:cytochrome c